MIKKDFGSDQQRQPTIFLQTLLKVKKLNVFALSALVGGYLPSPR